MCLMVGAKLRVDLDASFGVSHDGGLFSYRHCLGGGELNAFAFQDPPDDLADLRFVLGQNLFREEFKICPTIVPLTRKRPPVEGV